MLLKQTLSAHVRTHTHTRGSLQPGSQAAESPDNTVLTASPFALFVKENSNTCLVFMKTCLN